LNLSFLFSTATTLSWVADNDYTIVSAHKAVVAGSAYATTDKTLATVDTLIRTPASSFIAESLAFFLIGSGSIFVTQLDFSLAKGTTLFVTVSAANTCIITLIPVGMKILHKGHVTLAI